VKENGNDIYQQDGDYIKDIEVNDLRNRYTLTKGSTQKMVNITRHSLILLVDQLFFLSRNFLPSRLFFFNQRLRKDILLTFTLRQLQLLSICKS